MTGSLGTRRVRANGLDMKVLVGGTGKPVLLLHGWPFTSHLWRHVATMLIDAGHQVIAPDLRGIGGTDRPVAGYDLHTLADDALGLLDELGTNSAAVVGFDLGAPIAFMLGVREPHRVHELVLMEALIGRLPGAETFLANGPPWWFGFHAIPGLAETVLQGHEAGYIGWFLSARSPACHAVDPDAQRVYAQAYAGREALRGGFEHYRAMAANARHIAHVLVDKRVTCPTLAIAGGVVGEALHAQIAPHCDNLHRVRIADCGHNIPEEQPQKLAQVLLDFLS